MDVKFKFASRTLPLAAGDSCGAAFREYGRRCQPWEVCGCRHLLLRADWRPLLLFCCFLFCVARGSFRASLLALHRCFYGLGVCGWLLNFGFLFFDSCVAGGSFRASFLALRRCF